MFLLDSSSQSLDSLATTLLAKQINFSSHLGTFNRKLKPNTTHLLFETSAAESEWP